jgi:hypothetical protein
MNRRVFSFFLFFLVHTLPAFSWGPQGHRMIALIARSQLDRSVIETIDYYLNGTTWEAAATWMDDVAKDPAYSSMDSWHYVYFGKGKSYVATKEDNVVNKLEYCLRMLQYRTFQNEKTIHETLKILFHLIGDIHQPLHCGYPDDEGGNNVDLYMLMKETTLHKVWDAEIINNKKIDIWYCAKVLVGMKLSARKREELEKTDVPAWLSESRSLLPQVYATNGNKIDQRYLDTNAPIVEQQLIKAGLRLATILNKYFK